MSHAIQFHAILPMLLESALRACLLALTVWAGLRLFGIRNVLAQKSAWGLVLAAALVMPLAMQLGIRWQLLPAWAAIRLPQLSSAPATDPQLPPPSPMSIVTSHLQPIPDPSRPDPDHAAIGARHFSAPGVSYAELHSVDRAPLPLPSAPLPLDEPRSRPIVSLAALAWLLYLTVCAVLLFRLFYGLALSLHLWHRAQPLSLLEDGICARLAFGIPLRASSRVASPVTIGSAVILPADYAEWDAEKLRIVLAHERSHIRQGDFYLQLLAGIHASLFWFSPLGWWLMRKLSELAETISDRAGIEEASSRSSYAQVLLEFAALPRPTLIGVAMARRSTLSDRIERFLNESAFRHAFAGSRRRTFVAVSLVPLALFAATALIRVEAADSAKPAAPAIAAVLASPSQLPAQETSPITEASAALPSQPLSAALPSQPPSDALPSLPPAADPAPMPNPAPEATLESAANSERGPESTFERRLTVSGQVELSVGTGSGNIHLTRGGAGAIHIVGRVRSNDGENEEKVREVAANPPIEQAGNVVRIGGHQENLSHISISYEIEAPDNSILEAHTGSGDIADEGVGQQAKLSTGSGNIHADGLHGGFMANTGSGNIYIEQSGEGQVKAQTGSGDIELKGVFGALQALTGSGDIKITGTPSADWKLQTGSGNIELWPGNAPITLDASFGSGGLHTDHEMLTQGLSDRHHIVGKLNGGGPTVRMQTGSGDINVH